MMAIAVHRINASYDLVNDIEEYVLAVPGPTLARETLECGIRSMRDLDKAKEFNVRLCDSEFVRTPSLADAIANIELTKDQVIKTGDHALVIGRVVAFRVNPDRDEPPLLSIGPDERGYQLLERRGIHRVGTVTGR